MVRFGIIGTNTITDKLIHAASQHPQFELTAVYSRTEERAEEFASKHGASYTYTTIEEFVASSQMDAVYIASPNAFHKEQAIACMKQGKHVLCEKPMASNVDEVEEMLSVAEEEGVLLMEAVKSTLMPGFLKVKDNLHKIGRVRRFVGNFCKYSSRYDAYKEGTVMNAFNPKFSNGSLMDMGVYGIYPMVVLFGEPQSLRGNALFLESGVDGEGSITAVYDEMEAIIMFSKIQTSHTPSEIQGEEGAILIEDISEPSNIEIRYNNGKVEDLSVQQDFDPMYYEMNEFIKLIENGEKQSVINSHLSSTLASRIMTEARKQIGLAFPADLKQA
ncbi:Gfo/Idh/MocA family oxidoreductase [Halobacillus yeomjeoni]|uniref:Gfo/Idh/MocA family protein n=1 Tax=Halobacillus yeomjeoni TaxID=311194 RepID=UPI001CD817A5|nr:Gfo/Idh/MocA family oxidoreductase [Halobacillus yeomjeoni]MCA0984762.1 Gfo/Idh/MocA family oxidoreductase [Halobacillus yeomjeoni]